jgi:alpha-beta hydrolase superfamily lysophospholipase
MKKAGYFILAALIVLGGIEFFLYKSLTKFIQAGHTKEENDPKDMLLSSNDINFEAEDGTPLYGWLIQGKPGFPAVIIAHKYGTNRSATLLNMEGLISTLNKQGYYIFLFDFRGHGQSGGKSALGFKESEDVAGAIKALVKYKQIDHRFAVLGVGMGAIATARAFNSVDEVKVVLLDSIYDDVAAKYANEMIHEWPFLSFSRRVMVKAIDLNLKHMLKIPSTNLNLRSQMARLYPKAVIFIEKDPLHERVRTLYEAAREPKELLHLQDTAAGELIGKAREIYNAEVEQKIKKYLPPSGTQRTLDLPK